MEYIFYEILTCISLRGGVSQGASLSNAVVNLLVFVNNMVSVMFAVWLMALG